MVAKPSVLERVLRPSVGDVPPDFARKLLAMGFDPADQSRYEELSTRAQDGRLTEAERAELEDLLTANDVLAILRAKARVSLNNASAA